MRKHIRSAPLSVSAVCLMTLVVTMLPATLTRAADECVARPNAPAPAGQHWWYSTDRATKRKCWFLGPRDKAAAALKADRQGRVEERADAPAARPEAEPAPTPDSSPAPAARNTTHGVQSVVPVVQEGVPYLVDWSDLLKEAGIVSSEENILTGWGLRDRSVQEPTDAQPSTDARAPQAAAGEADTTHGSTNNSNKDPNKDLAATPAQMPLTFIAALVIIGGMGLTIFGIVRTQRRQNIQRNVDAPAIDAIDAYEGSFPAFLQRSDARSFPPGTGFDQEYEQASGPEFEQEHDQDYGRGYGGEAELRRILGLDRRAA